MKPILFILILLCVEFKAFAKETTVGEKIILTMAIPKACMAEMNWAGVKWAGGAIFELSGALFMGIGETVIGQWSYPVASTIFSFSKERMKDYVDLILAGKCGEARYNAREALGLSPEMIFDGERGLNDKGRSFSSEQKKHSQASDG